MPKNQIKLISHLEKVIEKLENKNIKLENAFHKIANWTEAYHVDIFTEPSNEDFKKARRILEENNLSLTLIAASNMRHVLSGIKNIVKNALSSFEY